MAKLSIVIPCYNEAATIATVLDRVLAVPLRGWEREVIVVDDASTDDTPQILKKYGSQIVTHRLNKNGGKGTAVQAGIALASGSHLLIQDADLEYAPEEIPNLLAALTGPESVVYGSRNLRHDPDRDIFWVPRAGVWVLTKLINVLFSKRLTDVWTCYKLFPSSARALFPGGGFDAEIRFTLELCNRGYSISEVPISHRPRTREEGKKIRYRDGLIAFADIVSYWARSAWVFVVYVVCVLALIAGSYAIFQPTLISSGDGPSYYDAIQVLAGQPAPPSFVPNRLVTSSLGLTLILLVAQVTGVLGAWILLNMLYLVLMAAFHYGILMLVFSDKRVAFVGGLFLMGNYAAVVFGVHYLMDAGGWFFYVLALYFLARYARFARRSDIYFAALSAGVGGVIKEYALLGAVAFGLYLLWEYKERLLTYVRQMVLPSLVVLAPLLTVAFAILQYFGYSYANWFSSNSARYVYDSRIIEYIKAGGSLVNVLAIPTLIGAFLLITKRAKELPPRLRAYLWCVLGSALPVFVWPAITQRILFATMPAVVLLASVAVWHYRDRWHLFVPLLLIYIAASFTMNAYILPLVNLPL